MKSRLLAVLAFLFAFAASANTTGRIYSSGPNGHVYANTGWSNPASGQLVVPVWDFGTFTFPTAHLNCATSPGTTDFIKSGGPNTRLEIDMPSNAGVASGDIVAFNIQICANTVGGGTARIDPYIRDVTTGTVYFPQTTSGRFFIKQAGQASTTSINAGISGNDITGTTVTIFVPHFPGGTRHHYVWGLVDHSSPANPNAKIFGVNVFADYIPWTPSGNNFSVTGPTSVNLNNSVVGVQYQTTVTGGVAEPMTVSIQDEDNEANPNGFRGTSIKTGVGITDTFVTGDLVRISLEVFGTGQVNFTRPMVLIFRSASVTKSIVVNVTENFLTGGGGGGGGNMTPPPPDNLGFSNRTRTQLKFFWSGSPSATSFTVTRVRSSDLQTITTTGITNTFLTDLDAPDDTSYTYSVVAVNAAGPSLSSSLTCNASADLSVPGC